MNHNDPPEEVTVSTCEDCRDLLYLYACDELEPHERAAMDVHLVSCPACMAALAEHLTLKQALPGAFVRRPLKYYSANN